MVETKTEMIQLKASLLSCIGRVKKTQLIRDMLLFTLGHQGGGRPTVRYKKSISFRQNVKKIQHALDILLNHLTILNPLSECIFE